MAKKHETLLCFGIDPVVEKFPKKIKGSAGKKIVKFYTSIIDSAPSGSFSALKPNYAYFAQYGIEGMEALLELIGAYKAKYTIILDVKRGDIASTATAYAKEGYEFFGAHALTLSPLMGKDSVEPYLKYFLKGKGAYLLCRTSNEGANDFLAQKMGGDEMYLRILQKGMQWHHEMGFVAGATSPHDLENILAHIPSNSRTPLLIPGVGSQGGSAQEVMQVLGKCQKMLPLARINASSSIAYAYKSGNKEDYVSAAHEQMKMLNKSLKYL